LAVGGVIVQSVAFGNRIDHGFYQVSPDFLLDYYEANGYEILAALAARIMSPAIMQPTIDYVRGCLDDRGDGGMDDGSYKVVLVGRKTAHSTKGHFPTPPSLAWAKAS